MVKEFPMSLSLPLHTTGPADAPKRGLWLHGFLGGGEEGARVFSGWGDDTCWICPDLPGHGRAPVRDFDLSSTLAAIAELAADCDWAAGYSMGGRLLLMAAARHPDAFRALIVESASPGLATAEEREARRALDGERADRLEREGLAAFSAWWYAQPMWRSLPSPPPRFGEAEALAAALRCFSPGHQPDLSRWLLQAPCPILWLAGAEDSAYRETAEDLHRRAARVRVETVPRAGHNIHLEQPDGWRRALRSFCFTTYAKEQ